MDKKEARLYCLTKRKENDKEKAKEDVIKAIIESDILNAYDHIGIYYPIGDEINIMPLMSLYRSKSFYLPKTEEEISFIKYDLGQTLFKGPFHTLEPKGEVVKRDMIECFIIPCVAITKDNYRIGYGKGYYDRYLAGYKGKKIGITYSNTILDCNADSFDVLLDDIFVG